MRARIFFLFIASTFFVHRGFAQKTASGARIDSLSESQIDIPIFVNLKPIYALAEKNVDTVFTSPDYPNGWVQADCATRYKYHFRRSPLQMSMKGTTLQLAFTGYYQITGSTRACVKGTAVSPWTPSCRCGFDEGERKVGISFSSSFKLHSNYVLQNTIIRNEPVAMDACTVCFWGQDITSVVMQGLKAKLDLSKKAMDDSFRLVNLRPYMQQAWDLLKTPYPVPGIGYFSLNPKKLRMQNLNAKDDQLQINIGITAAPVVSFLKPATSVSRLPNLSTTGGNGGFNVYLEAALQYDSLSGVMNGYLAGKRFELSEGLIKKHIIVDKAEVRGDSLGQLLIDLDFSGSFSGKASFVGKPVYDADKKMIEVENLDYDLKTKSFLLNTAKWLFNKRILSELKKYTKFDLAPYYDTAARSLDGWLNREWTKGISGTGGVTELKLTGLQALPEHLLIRSNCVGKLDVHINEIEL